MAVPCQQQRKYFGTPQGARSRSPSTSPVSTSCMSGHIAVWTWWLQIRINILNWDYNSKLVIQPNIQKYGSWHFENKRQMFIVLGWADCHTFVSYFVDCKWLRPQEGTIRKMVSLGKQLANILAIKSQYLSCMLLWFETKIYSLLRNVVKTWIGLRIVQVC